ncbi:sodium:proton antiporter [Roseomonas sp. PWR1]|uniref:Sodium:proton antiporter n=1 Tax=Roseomonas nitratireducens TaxID=2820810 RepID=A0ABS4ANJ9_9PROT|nr:sodium:proton antiporter [Neoroseomonas nitratireducens]MBP0462938.1 sodium:proton antiporter [Neoroseomonas nitratireducens]
MRRSRAVGACLLVAGLLATFPGQAAAAGVSGAGMSLAWGIPFAGLLLSIALMPLVAGHVWHHHYGKIAAGWGALLVLPFAVVFGPDVAAAEVWHILLQEYIPFIALLLALYVTGGGVLLKGTLVGTPATNTALLAFGTVIASIMGTTGASMLLIRPVLRANAFRKRKTHTFVFFIFLVSNIGGSLTPLGDPPLYLGFLKGVSFFWTTTHMFGEFLVCAVILLAVYYVLDSRAWAKEQPVIPDTGAKEPLRLEGTVNLALIGAVVLMVLAQGYWRPGEVALFGDSIGIERLVGIAVFVAIAFVSMRVTSPALREANGFAWGAILEVAKLFAAIFVTMAPVLAILRAGMDGAAAPLVALTSDPAGQPVPWVYFWLTGALSSFLDNAPTYLVFFNLAGGDPAYLMTQGALTLAAISCGAVFMGANSYIGNAPNFMVKAIVEENGERMPSFFGYCGWAVVFLIPLFILVTLIFF